MAASSKSPIERSKYMAHARAQVPLSVFNPSRAVVYPTSVEELVDNVYANSAYQARELAKGCHLWTNAVKKGNTVWLGISGAATPAGLGGIVSEMIEGGAVHAICSTGANVYHDLHFAFALPVRQGSAHINDEAAARDGTTRIYDQYIHNKFTLCAQDALLYEALPKALEQLKPPYSSASLLNALGKVCLESKRVKDSSRSFVLTAAKCGVPIFLDSHHNHSLGMVLSLLEEEGYKIGLAPMRDLKEGVAYILRCQPQFNVFLGEGGPRNFIQTLAPTASEIFYIPFEGSEGGGIKFSTADERAGALSGSTFKEAHTWGKYPDASMRDKADIWGEYTMTFPIAASYVLGKCYDDRLQKRLFDKRDRYYDSFLRLVDKHKPDRQRGHAALISKVPAVQRCEMRARRKAEKQ